jgi:hypothetical protein
MTNTFMTNSFTTNLLIRANREPGLCNEAEITLAMSFYKDLNDLMGTYEKVHNYNPFGSSIQVRIDELQFYINRFDGESK